MSGGSQGSWAHTVLGEKHHFRGKAPTPMLPKKQKRKVHSLVLPSLAVLVSGRVPRLCPGEGRCSRPGEPVKSLQGPGRGPEAQ